MSAVPGVGSATGPLPKVAWGRGSYLYDTTGKQYIDGSGGPAVYCLGHGHPEVNAAITEQLGRVAHGYRYIFTSEPLEELSAHILRSCDGAFRHLVYVSGGSEAVESCLKIALQYWSAVGEPNRRRFIARKRSWHGNTLGALSVSEFAERQRPFEGSLLPVSHVSAANAYRPPEGVEPADLAEHLGAELEAEILRLGPERVAAFIFEPVVGAAGGVVPAPPGYAQKVRDLCDKYGLLLIADEVMCGSGRCGTWRALAFDGVVPDIMSIAKGLAGGYLPLGAALYSARVGEPIMTAHGGVFTGHTFSGHTAACAAGLAVQKIVERDGLLARVRDKGEAFRAALGEALAPIEEVGDVRGRGFFVGIELVQDRAGKQPFPPDRRLFQAVSVAAMELGLICYPCSGNVDGQSGDTVILAPPYNASDTELEEILEKQKAAIERALAITR
jgi:adenosylmethionine-8-amino-7-oxononanoate aminotransferase